MRKLLLLCLVAITGCAGVPQGVETVRDFQPQRYTGTWYEIARLENRFEKGLEKITAEYTPRDDGGLDVTNRGYEPASSRWKESTGRAYFVGAPSEGRLKVTFFWPFYGAYNIILLDDQYQWSLVCGPDRSYLWVLARTPTLPQPTLARIIDYATKLGFATDQLIYVDH
jgi:apolipoprotein D and lipocalin family protein